MEEAEVKGTSTIEDEGQVIRDDRMENNLATLTKKVITLKEVLEDLQGGEEETQELDLEGEVEDLQDSIRTIKWPYGLKIH